MSKLARRTSTALAVQSNVVYVRRVEPRLDVRFGHSRVRMETLEARRHLNAGGIVDFNGITLPEIDSSWSCVTAIDEAGSSIEATTADGSVYQLDLIANEDGSQQYEVSMSSLDPQIMYMTGGLTDPIPYGIEQAQGTPTIDLADVSEAYPVLSLSISADGVVSAGDVTGISSDISGSIYLNDMIIPAHVVQQADGTFALASDYAPSTFIRNFSGGVSDPTLDPDVMFKATRDVALADFNNWGVTEINVDDNGVVTAVADGEPRVVTLADGDRGAILIDGNDTGYELQQGREEGWTLASTYETGEPAYFGEPSITLADFNGWGVTEIAIDEAGNITATADGSVRNVMIDENGMISVEGTFTNLMLYTDGVNSGLMQIYTIEDNVPPVVDDGSLAQTWVALADFNNWGVTEINVDGNGIVTAVADGQARDVVVDAETREISIDGNFTGYILAQGRESGYTLSMIDVVYYGGIENGGATDFEPTAAPADGPAVGFAFNAPAPVVIRGETIATGLFATKKSIVDSDEQSVL